MDLVDDDKLPTLCSKIRVGVSETALIGRPLQIEVDRAILAVRCDLPGKCRLADLTGTEQHDAWHVPKSVLNQWAETA